MKTSTPFRKVLLIDTEALIWYATGSRSLSERAAEAIQRGGSNSFSYVTVWELAVKSSLDKIQLSFNGQRTTALQFTLAVAARLQLVPLQLELEDLADVESLPLHHRDPFDRLLITQAKRRGLPIVSADAVFDRYGIQRVW